MKSGQQVKIGKIELNWFRFISEKRYLHCVEREIFLFIFKHQSAYVINKSSYRLFQTNHSNEINIP